jgi:DNA ligase-1
MSVLLAKTWAGSDPSGWWMSEKLDGVRAVWDCRTLITRNGQPINAPAWFTGQLPKGEPLDGELWIGRGQFQKTVGVVRSQSAGDEWRAVRFAAFDAPMALGGFEERHAAMRDALANCGGQAFALPQRQCSGQADLLEELNRVQHLGGEGLMLRQPASRYERKRSGSLLKVKTFHDAEATVIGYEGGTGRNADAVGALVARLPDGTQFCVSSGLTDAMRRRPPAIGAVFTFKYQQLTDAGVPRFPSFCRVA